MNNKKILIVCTTDSMIWNFLIPHIKDLQNQGNIVECACSRTGFYMEELRDIYNLTIHEINFSRSPFRLNNITALVKLTKLIKKEQYDIVHSHEPVGGVIGRMSGKICNKKTIYTTHGFHFFRQAPLKHWIIYYSIEKIMSYFTDVIITINQEDYDNAKRFKAKSVYYIPGIGVDLERYSEANFIDNNILDIKSEFNIKENDKILISVGELSDRKNHEIVIRSMEKRKNEDIKYIICGEGELDLYLKNLCKELEIEDKVIFAGFRRDVSRLLLSSDIFIFPSKWEGLGLAGIEAISCGVPIIASNRHGIKDYVIDKVTGLLIDPEDENSINEAIDYMMKNTEQVLNMKEEARHIIEKYKLSNSINEMRKIYDKEI